MSEPLSHEMIYRIVKASTPPVPAIFKMAMNTTFVLIRKEAKAENANDEQ